MHQYGKLGYFLDSSVLNTAFVSSQGTTVLCCLKPIALPKISFELPLSGCNTASGGGLHPDNSGLSKEFMVELWAWVEFWA